MILFFDTETTGLPKSWKAPVTDLNNWPRLVQLAYLYYDNNGNKISGGDFIIKPDGFIIPTDASNIHGIFTDRANREGQQLEGVLRGFQALIDQAEHLVAHNMSFDEKIVGAEFLRNNMPNGVAAKKKICTMQSSTNFCAIDGPYGYKWPKLSELHYKLFRTGFAEAHNAAVDITATAKCFWRLVELGVIKLEKLNQINTEIKQHEAVKKALNFPKRALEGDALRRLAEYIAVDIKNEMAKEKVKPFNLKDYMNKMYDLVMQRNGDANLAAAYAKAIPALVNRFQSIDKNFNNYVISDISNIAVQAYLHEDEENTKVLDFLGITEKTKENAYQKKEIPDSNKTSTASEANQNTIRPSLNNQYDLVKKTEFNLEDLASVDFTLEQLEAFLEWQFSEREKYELDGYAYLRHRTIRNKDFQAKMFERGYRGSLERLFSKIKENRLCLADIKRLYEEVSDYIPLMEKEIFAAEASKKRFDRLDIVNNILAITNEQRVVDFSGHPHIYRFYSEWYKIYSSHTKAKHMVYGPEWIFFDERITQHIMDDIRDVLYD